MTVILLLLIVFGVVLVMRLTRSNPDEQLASAAERDAGKHKPAGSADGDSLFRDLKPKPHSGGVPTVVPAKAAPIKPPKTFDSDLDKWKLASDKTEPKRRGSHDLAPSLPPPTLPDPPKTPADQPIRPIRLRSAVGS